MKTTNIDIYIYIRPGPIVCPGQNWIQCLSLVSLLSLFISPCLSLVPVCLPLSLIFAVVLYCSLVLSAALWDIYDKKFMHISYLRCWSTSSSVWDICDNEYDIHLSSLQFLVDFLQLLNLPPRFAQILSESSKATLNRRKPNEATEKLTKINIFNRKGNVRLKKTLCELLLPYKHQGKAMQNQRNLHKTKENHSKTTIFTEIGRKQQ